MVEILKIQYSNYLIVFILQCQRVHNKIFTKFLPKTTLVLILYQDHTEIFTVSYRSF